MRGGAGAGSEKAAGGGAGGFRAARAHDVAAGIDAHSAAAGRRQQPGGDDQGRKFDGRGRFVSLRYEEVAEILKIIDSSSCDELIVETGDIKLVVRRNGATGHVAPAFAAPEASVVEATPRARADASASTSASASVGAAAARSSTMEQRPAAGQIEVTAPMVGTFYRAPSPDAPPFVEVGSIVKPGQPLCIIEVMKLFTTINSEWAGRVVQIRAEVGELVEYGRTLFVIEPA